jgi:hypothetical protein
VFENILKNRKEGAQCKNVKYSTFLAVPKKGEFTQRDLSFDIVCFRGVRPVQSDSWGFDVLKPT